jgi:hypothetical protein
MDIWIKTEEGPIWLYHGRAAVQRNSRVLITFSDGSKGFYKGTLLQACLRRGD